MCVCLAGNAWAPQVLYELDSVARMLDTFEAKMLATLVSWCDNLVEIEAASLDSLDHSEEEGLHSRGPIDLFKMVQQQLASAHDTVRRTLPRRPRVTQSAGVVCRLGLGGKGVSLLRTRRESV
eukprot:SAG11_NODE_13119_length_668_cov_1.029825_1_plen_123_part_00